MAKNYTTGLIITGDASGGIRAIRATDDQLGKLNKGFERGSKRSRQFNRDVNLTSKGLGMLRRAAAPVAATIAGMFAANSLKNQIDFADQLQKTNLRIGASTEALSQYNYVAKLSGVELNTLTTAWQRQTRRIAEAAEGAGPAADALDRIGLSAQSLKNLSPEDQFEEIAAAMEGVASESERVALAQKIWDSEGVKLVQIVNQGTDAIAAMRAEADALGLTISQETANSMATYNDEVDRLKFAAQGVSQTLLAELVPALTDGLQSTSAFIQEMGGAEAILSRVFDVGQVLAVLLAGRFAGSIATATAAKLAATQQALAYQAALMRMAGASRTATAASTAMAGAVRGGAAAMALMGGPAGVAMLAAAGIYTFREELGLVQPQVETASQRVDKLTGSLKTNSQAALDNAKAMLEAEIQLNKFNAATLAMQVEQQRQVVFDEQKQWDAVGGQEAFGMGQRSESQERLHELQVSLSQANKASEAASKGIGEVNSKIAELESASVSASVSIDDKNSDIEASADLAKASTKTLEDNAKALKESASSSSTASEAVEDHSKEVDSLRRSLDPAYARQQDFAEATATLDKGLMTGQLTLQQYTALWDMAAEKMAGAGDATEDLADKSTDAADEMSREWERFGNAIDDTFADAFKGAFDSFDDFASSIKDSFETLIAEMAYAAFKNEIKINLGMEGSGPMSGGLGSIGDQISGIFGAGSKIPGIGNLIGKAGSALGFGGSVAGASLGGMSGGLSSTAITSANAVAGGASSGLMGAMGSAMPWIGGGMMLDSVFDLGIGDAISDGLGKIKTGLFGGDWEMKDAGFNLGIEDGQIAGSQFERERKSGGLFSGASYRTKESELSSELQASLQSTLDAQDAALRGTVEALGLQEDAFEGFNTEITKISTKGMEEGEAQAAIQGWLTSTIRDGVESVADSAGLLGSVGDALARGFESLDDQQFIESAQKAMQLEHFGNQIGGSMRDDIFDHMRIVTESGAQDVRSSIDGLSDAMAGAQVLIGASERLNLQFDATAGGAIHAAFAMQDLVGGVENLSQLQSSYYQNYFTEAERAAHLQDELTASMQQMGLQLPETRDGFRQLVEAQDLNTQAGRENYAQLLQLSGSFAELEGAASGADGAVQGASDAMREREALERELMRVQGDTAGLREQELQELDPSNRALQERIWEIESEQEASKASAEAARESARAQEQARRATEQAIKAAKDQVRQAYQRFDNQAFDLQISYLDLLGDSEAALTRQRERELDAMDESLHPFQRRLWALEDEAAAQERAKEAGQQYAQELESIQGQLSKTFSGINEWIDKRNATSGTPRQNLDETGEQFAEQLKAAQAGDRSALESITQYADAYLSAGETMFASGSEFQKLQADVISKLEDLPEQISAEEFLAQEIRDALQAVVIADMPTDDELAGKLRAKMTDVGAKQLTARQVRNALSPIATDAEIDRLITRADSNADGLITQQELLADKIGGLADGIGAALSPMFDSIDLDASGLIDWDEFYGAFQGLASDEQLKGIYDQLDANGDGQISELEALNKSTAGTQENTKEGGKSIAERASEQLASLGTLSEKMEENVSGLIGLDESIMSLSGAINKLINANENLLKLSVGEAPSTSPKPTMPGAPNGSPADPSADPDTVAGGLGREYQRYQDDWDRLSNNPLLANSTPKDILDRSARGVGGSVVAEMGSLIRSIKTAGGSVSGGYIKDINPLNFFANGGVFTNGIVSEPTSFDMGVMGEGGRSEAIMPLERGPGGVLGVQAWSAPTMLSGNDVRDVLTDMRQELQALRRENSDLQSRIADNTGGTAGAVMQGNRQAERQRDTQIQEQRRQTRAQRIKERG